MRKILLLGVALLVVDWAVAQERTASPKGAEVDIVSPTDGATVTSPVRVRFGLKGMGIAPAGIAFENSGHHHLLIDTEVPKDLSQPVPTDANHVHFGKGQTETELTLAPGRHTLQLLLGDHLHVPHAPPVMSKKITITVTTPAAAKSADKPAGR
ncbi:MAG TPA: DUF4399 domain-containing protein [Steroidobacteraceae bacterium]|nr:DUF4399 domain-containing protein [Steroidobacteraceae bacterium]